MAEKKEAKLEPEIPNSRNKVSRKPEENKEEEPEEAEEEAEGKVSLEVEKEVMEEVPSEKEVKKELPKATFDVAGWEPKTSVGKDVKASTITDIDEILDNGKMVLEAQIIDILIPDIESDLLLVGQSKGKFGGGQRSVFKQTQKKTREGNKPKFGTFAVVGNHNGYVGIGYGKSKETVPAREKAIRNAKLNVFKIRRGCGSWQCGCRGPHSIPFKVEGKCGSVVITLMPAPKGKGLCVESECAKILNFAGIKDVWSRTKGQTVSKGNLVKACAKALKQLENVKINPQQVEGLGICEGKIKEKEEENE
jgi:small subunit ribosomal protein S5